MLKAKLPDIDGKPSILIGLTEENVKRLKTGKPMKFSTKLVGVDATVFIAYGETEEALVEMLDKGKVQTAVGKVM